MNAPLTTASIVVAAVDQVSCNLGEEAAILNLNSSVYYGLDPVGARVWRLLQNPCSVTQILDVLLNEYDVESSRCELDLLALLNNMRDEGLIEVKNSAAGS